VADHRNESQLYENNTHVFVVKIWLETNKQQLKWRGYITNVLSGERHYFEDLFEIAIFINSDLTKMDVKTDRFWRFLMWLKGRRNQR
jgi:hypothetical protein